MDAAPLHIDIAQGPPGGQAWWVTAGDGVNLRVAHWPADGSRLILLFPGRTEYIEKYGRVAGDLVAAGFDVLVIDWRGQGLSQRLTADRRVGHVEAFSDYQLDVAALVEVADTLGISGPRYLLAHSMGGAIGLRALHNGLAVSASAFSSPMWKIRVARSLLPFARWATRAQRILGFGGRFVPRQSRATYVDEADFEANSLTGDRDTWAYMVAQAQAVPELVLAGPSIAWFDEALNETRKLRALGPPSGRPVLTGLGDADTIVDLPAPTDLMQEWPQGQLVRYKDAQHELLMEVPSVRTDFLNATTALFMDQATS